MKKETIIVLSYFILATCFATFPLVLHLASSLPHDGDELFITWVVNWNIHSFLTNPVSIYDANIFYPYHNTLAYSESFLTASVVGIIPYFIFGQPTAVYNVVLLFAYASFGFCTCLLVKYLSKSVYAGVISGTLVAFSTYTVTKTMHLQLIGIALLPLSILFFLQYADTKKTKYLCFVALCFILQMANSFLPAYFIIFSLLFIWVSFYFTNKKKFYTFLQKKVLLIGIIAILLVLPLVLPYVQVSQQFHYQRDIRDAIHFANRPEYTFYPSDRTRLQNTLMHTIYLHDKGPYTYDGYIGLGFFLLLAITFIVYFWKQRKEIPYFLTYFYLGCFGFILSLGPAFQWGGKVIKFPFLIPLPYAIFYYILPGFTGMRNSSRWEMLFLFAMSVSIGLFLSSLFKKLSQKTLVMITICLCTLVLGEIPLPMPLQSIPPKENIPQTYYYLTTLPENSVVMEMPAYVWYMSPYANQEVYREYFSIVDFKKRVNGASGFSPLSWEKQTQYLLGRFPNKTSVRLLKSMGVSYLVVHAREYDVLGKNRYNALNKDITNGNDVITQLQSNSQVTLLKKIQNDYIYKLQ